ncbi:hypothetical protein Tco_0185529 [Tanacetum coccineum]
MPGRGDGKRNGSEERNWGSQCFSTLNEMRQPRDALLLTPQGSETELNLSLVTVPISTNHCFQIRLLVDIYCNSSIREANCCVEESISLHKPRGISCATPPGRMKLACILAPETLL